MDGTPQNTVPSTKTPLKRGRDASKHGPIHKNTPKMWTGSRKAAGAGRLVRIPELVAVVGAEDGVDVGDGLLAGEGAHFGDGTDRDGVPVAGVDADGFGEADALEDTAFAAVVGGQGELDILLGVGAVRFEHFSHPGEVLGAGADVEFRVGELGDGVAVGEDLHQADGAARGDRVDPEAGFVADDRRDEPPVPTEFGRIFLDMLVEGAQLPARLALAEIILLKMTVVGDEIRNPGVEGQEGGRIVRADHPDNTVANLPGDKYSVNIQAVSRHCRNQLNAARQEAVQRPFPQEGHLRLQMRLGGIFPK